ncbi:hypothetical protein V1525DRAFT_411648 [Lipomyces kononenkoae]|uniref:Uncharacterized protein n=1 Tax=Lipomyces kononenkoae TaxID=34357 RepID=A0ACC3SVU5_LIPKO
MNMAAAKKSLRPFRLHRHLCHLRERYISDWTIFNHLIVASAVFVFFLTSCTN